MGSHLAAWGSVLLLATTKRKEEDQTMIKEKLALKMIVILYVTSLLGCATTKGDWKNATQLNTIQAYREFIVEHPQTKFTSLARKKIEKLEWESTKRGDNLENYQQFISKYPYSDFTNSAKKRLEIIEMEKAKTINSYEAYKTFLKKYPSSEFKTEVTELLGMLEKSYWQKAIELNTVEEYKAFLKMYPESKFASTAEDRIKSFMKSANCREQKSLYHNIEEVLSKKTKDKFKNLYGDCILADNFCEYCGQPAVGWCHMRHKYVCDKHRYFTQGGTYWRCP